MSPIEKELRKAVERAADFPNWSALERLVRATLDGAIHPADPVIRDARALIEKMRA